MVSNRFFNTLAIFTVGIHSALYSVAAHAAESKQWEPIKQSDYISIGILSAGALGFTLMTPNASTGWTNGFLYDDAIRGSLRIDSQSGRGSAASVSNIGLGVGIAAPLLLDSVGLAWGRDRNSSKAWRIAVVDVQALMATAFLTQATKIIIGRGRPYLKGCATDSGYEDSCNSSDAYASFFSGHTSMAFTGASLLCTTHDKLSLFEETWANRAVCAGAMSLAATTGILRIAADRHYATDVTVGALVGLFSGFYIPTHFHGVEGEEHPGTVQTQLMLLPAGDGALSATEVIRF